MRKSLLLALSGVVLMSCSGAGDSGGGRPSGGQPNSSVEQAAQSGPYSVRLNAEFDKHYAEVQGLSYAQLQAAHADSYLASPSFDVTQATYYSQFVDTFALSTGAQDKLKTLGFVVVPAPARVAGAYSLSKSKGAGPADIFYRVFAANLPVFVSADSILHAWHRSFDALLENSESSRMVPLLQDLLSKTASQLDPSDQAQRDALFYLTVARVLLDSQTAVPPSVNDDVQRYLQWIAAHQLVQQADFMGMPTDIDFSQFIPRGHYTHSEQLQRYFQAMMWLGRTDLVLLDKAEARPREEAAARALAHSLDLGGGVGEFNQMNTFYAAFVGHTNAITPTGLLDLCTQAGLASCVGDASSMQSVYAAQPAPEYSSRVFAGAIPPIAMRFFPQRFAYDAWVTTRTTTPRLLPAVQGGRAMAMPEDVAFAAGSNRALKYFDQDMSKPFRENLPATLEATRRTMQAITPTQVDNTAFNNWLEGLIALSQPTTDARYPEVMRTGAWHDRKLEATLASWAELRHDTILVVEQSTGGIGCQYPKGYVDPVPALYRSISAAIDRLRPLWPSDATASSGNVPGFFDEFQQELAQLAAMAEEELLGQPMTDAELQFLNQTADLHGNTYYGDRQYNGWYPRLFWTPSWNSDPTQIDGFDAPSGISEPVVADVHTDAENGLALEVGVGHPGLVVIAIDNQGDRSLYGGPASSFYTEQVPLDQRSTDNAWLDRVDGRSLPERPAFARGYWAE